MRYVSQMRPDVTHQFSFFRFLLVTFCANTLRRFSPFSFSHYSTEDTVTVRVVLVVVLVLVLVQVRYLVVVLVLV